MWQGNGEIQSPYLEHTVTLPVSRGDRSPQLPYHVDRVTGLPYLDTSVTLPDCTGNPIMQPQHNRYPAWLAR
jgi:hypothetical protein